MTRGRSTRTPCLVSVIEIGFNPPQCVRRSGPVNAHGRVVVSVLVRFGDYIGSVAPCNLSAEVVLESSVDEPARVGRWRPLVGESVLGGELVDVVVVDPPLAADEFGEAHRRPGLTGFGVAPAADTIVPGASVVGEGPGTGGGVDLDVVHRPGAPGRPDAGHAGGGPVGVAQDVAGAQVPGGDEAPVLRVQGWAAVVTSSPRSVVIRRASTSRWVNVAVAGRPVSGSAEATRSAGGLILQEVLDDLFSHGSHETVLVGQGEVGDAADLVLQADVVQEVGVRPPGEVVDLGVLAQPGEDRGHEHGAEPAHGEHAQQPPGVGGPRGRRRPTAR